MNIIEKSGDVYGLEKKIASLVFLYKETCKLNNNSIKLEDFDEDSLNKNIILQTINSLLIECIPIIEKELKYHERVQSCKNNPYLSKDFLKIIDDNWNKLNNLKRIIEEITGYYF